MKSKAQERFFDSNPRSICRLGKSALLFVESFVRLVWCVFSLMVNPHKIKVSEKNRGIRKNQKKINKVINLVALWRSKSFHWTKMHTILFIMHWIMDVEWKTLIKGKKKTKNQLEKSINKKPSSNLVHHMLHHLIRKGEPWTIEHCQTHHHQ